MLIYLFLHNLFIYVDNNNGDIMYYIKNFLFYSILGFLFKYILSGKSGILYLFWTPVYGIGVLVLYLIYKLLDRFKLNILIKYIIIFILSMLSLTLLELLGGYLLEEIFGVVFWDYTKMKYNFGKYICLELALVWGLFGIILYFIKPFVDKLIKKIPNFIVIILFITFILDILVTLIVKSKLF